jgi:hypothetical protein
MKNGTNEKIIQHVYRLQEFTYFIKINNKCVPHKLIFVDNCFIHILASSYQFIS